MNTPSNHPSANQFIVSTHALIALPTIVPATMAGAKDKRKAVDKANDGSEISPRRGAKQKSSKTDNKKQVPRRSSSRTSRRLQPPPNLNDSALICSPCGTSTRAVEPVLETVPQPPSHYFHSRDMDLSCLGFRLNPGIARQRKIICSACLLFYDKRLKLILHRQYLDVNKRSQVKDKEYLCSPVSQRPKPIAS